MSDSIPSPAAAVPPKLSPVTVMAALASNTRWAILKWLADGRKMSVSQLATTMNYTVDSMGRQMKVMADAGVVDACAGEDRRQTIYSIPASRRPSPGVIDYGFCVIDLNK